MKRNQMLIGLACTIIKRMEKQELILNQTVMNIPENVHHELIDITTQAFMYEIKLLQERFNVENKTLGNPMIQEQTELLNVCKDIEREWKEELLEKLKQVNEDDDVFKAGFTKCLGMIDNVYPELPLEILDNYYRTWIWEDQWGNRVATWDNGNGYCSFMCEGTTESIEDYVGIHSEKEELTEPLPEENSEAFKDENLPF